MDALNHRQVLAPRSSEGSADGTAQKDAMLDGFLQFSELPTDSRVCEPVYGPSSSGSTDDMGLFGASFRSRTRQKGRISYLFYNYEDENKIGARDNSSGALTRVFCEAKDKEKDSECEPGLFIVSPEIKETSQRGFRDLPADATIDPASWVIQEKLYTGYYCIMWTSDIKLSADSANEGIGLIRALETSGSTGLMPAREYPMLVLAWVLLCIYVTAFIAWSVRAVKYRRDLMPTQHYLTGMLFVTFVDSAVHLAYLKTWNDNATKPVSLWAVWIILSSARVSLGFFVLLLVCLGYNLAVPSLAKETMRKSVALGVLHFSVLSLYMFFESSTFRSTGSTIRIIVVIIFLWVFTSAFYIATLNGLSGTMQFLRTRHQEQKLKLYKRVRNVIGFAATNFILYAVVNVFWRYLSETKPSFDAKVWRFSWFVYEGWMSIVFCLCVLYFSYLWLPTNNNVRYGLEQIVSDPLEKEFDFNESAVEAAAAIAAAADARDRENDILTGFTTSSSVAGGNAPASMRGNYGRIASNVALSALDS